MSSLILPATTALAAALTAVPPAETPATESIRESRTGLSVETDMHEILKEVRRRTRVVGAFPDGHSALMLVAARLRHIAGTKWGTKKYLDVELLKNLSRSAASTG